MGRKLLRWAAFTQCIYGLLCVAALSIAWAQAQPEGTIEATVFVDRGLILYQDKKFEEALKEFQEASRLNPENVDALYYQGLTYVALGRAGDAQGVLEKARKMRPDDFDVLFQLGALYFNQKEYEKAEPLLRQVYQFEPTRPNIGYYLGFIEYRKKNYREALTFLRGNVPSDDEFAQIARFYAGLTMSALGFPREARAEIEQALKLQPVSPLTAPAQRFGEILQRAEQREQAFRGDLRLGVYYDTNVPVTPNSSTDLTALTSREDTRRRKSEGQLATLNLSYTWLKTPDWEGTVSHRFLQTYNDHLPNLNTQSNTPTIGITTQGVMPAAFGDFQYVAGLQATYDFITIGNSRFTERGIINPFFTAVEPTFEVGVGPGMGPVTELLFGPKWDGKIANLTTYQFRYQVKNFFNDKKQARAEVRDANNYMVGPLHFFIFEEGKHYFKLGYQFDFEDAEGKNWSHWGHRYLMGFQYGLPWWELKFRYDLDAHWRFHRYKHSLQPTEATGTRHRRDREPVHLVSLSKDFLNDFTVSLDYLFDKNKSNIATYDYNRHVVTTSVTWRFGASAFENLGTSLGALFE